MRTKFLKRICSAILAVAMLISMAPVTTFAIIDEDIPASVELGKGFNLLDCKTFESANLKSAILFDNVEALNPTKVRLGNVESSMTYITSMSSYLDNTHTDISTEVGVTKEGLLAKAEVKAKFGFKGEWESSGKVNTSRLILEILAKAYKYSLNMEMSDPWAKSDGGEYASINPTFAYDLVHMRPQDLFNTYGTHIVTQYDAGGEAYTSYEGTDASNSMKSEFDITANAEVKVSAADVADVNVAVNTSGGEKHEESFANNNKQTSMRVRGGDPFYSTFDKIISGDADESVNSWLQSMFTQDENTGSTKATMIQSENLMLMPVWELLEMDYGTDHSERVSQLREYFQENANREYLELYEEFIYGIPGDYADNYDVIRKAVVNEENLDAVETAPEGRIAIYTEAELNKIGKSEDYPLDGNYILMRDIELKYDFGGIGYTANKTIEPFTGDFDGNGHTLYDLNPIARYNGTDEVYMGFILYNEGNLYNIRFVDSNYDCRESKKTTTSIKANVANTATAYLGLAVGRNVAAADSSNLSNIYIDNATFIIKNAPYRTYAGLAAGCIADTNFVSDITVVNSYLDVSAASDDGLHHIGAVCGASSSGAGMISHDNVVKCDKDAFVGGCIGSFVSDTNDRVETYSYDNIVESANMSNYQLSGYGDLNAYSFGGADKYALTNEKVFKYYCDNDKLLGGMGGYAEEWIEHSRTESKPWLIVHAPDGMTAYQNSLISMKNLKVYFAQYGDDTSCYEDVTDRVNFVYDFGEVAQDVPVTIVYGKHIVDLAVDVLEPVAVDIAVINAGKTQFRVGEKFDNSKLEGQILYSNNFTGSFSANGEALKVYIPEFAGDEPINVGEYEFEETSTGTDVVVEYLGCTTTYRISVLPEDMADKLQFVKNSFVCAPGGEFEIKITLKNNVGIAAFGAHIEYDNDSFELVEVRDTGLLSGFQNVDGASTIPLLWMDVSASENNTENGDIAIVKFRAKEDASIGSKKIKLVFDGATNAAGEKVLASKETTYTVQMYTSAVGDVDSSNKIDIWDSVLLTRFVYDQGIFGVNRTASDINRDDYINIIDSTLLNRHNVGLFGIDGAPGSFNVRLKSDIYTEDKILEGVIVNRTIPEPEEILGYIFKGYYLDKDFNNKVEVLPEMSVKEIVLYPQYEAGYVVESDLELVNNIFIPGQALELRHIVDNHSYIENWDVYEGDTLAFTGTSIPADYVPTAPLKVVAKDVVAAKFDITYVSEDEFTHTNPSSYTYGEAVTLTKATSVANQQTGRNVINFKGWYNNPEFSGLPVTSISANTAEDVTLYAKWEKASWLIKLDPKGGIVENGILVHTYGTETVMPIPTHPNADYTFSHWTLNGGQIDGIPADFYSSNVGGVLDAAAVWTYAPTVQLTLRGSSTEPNSDAVVTKTITAGKSYNLGSYTSSNVKTSDGKYYTFRGWYRTGTDLFITKNSVPGIGADLDLTAVWEEVSITINYYDENENLIETQNYDYYEGIDGILALEPEPREGYHFAGWRMVGTVMRTWPYIDVSSSAKGTTVFNYMMDWVADGDAYPVVIKCTTPEGQTSRTGNVAVMLFDKFSTFYGSGTNEHTMIFVPKSCDKFETTIWWKNSGTAYENCYMRFERTSLPACNLTATVRDGRTFYMSYKGQLIGTDSWKGTIETYSTKYDVILDDGTVTRLTHTTGTATALPVNSKDGYSFGGWYDNAEFNGNPITEIPADHIGDIVLFAKWIAN